MSTKPIYVAFANKKLENEFEKLNKGKHEEELLYLFIQHTIDDLKKNPMCGTKIKKSLWPN